MQNITSQRLRNPAEKKLRKGSRLGKYRIDRKLGTGGFATVYAATDTLLGVKVALKIPFTEYLSSEMLDEFRREARLTLELEHPNILSIRDATFIDDQFVIVSPLGQRTLQDRLQKRIAFDLAYDLISQLIDGVAYAHHHGVIHCDIKPDNILLFPDDQLKLTDFGIAKVAFKTISGSGTGTIGYMAPEQAMGRPSKRSDVFSIGLIAYRMLSGKWPEYPFEWPMVGAAQLRRRAHPDLVAVIRKSIATNPRKRFADAESLQTTWEKTRLKAIRYSRRHRNGS